MVYVVDPALEMEVSRLKGALADEKLGDILGPITLHRLRHTGASLDAFHHFRDAAGVQRQGRWGCPESVRRYQNATRLPEMLRQLTPAQLARARRLSDSMSTWLRCA